MSWTEDRVDQFRKLYADGLPHSSIAAEMGISRNASIGKAHRMGLTARVQKSQPQPWIAEGVSERTWQRRKHKIHLRRSVSHPKATRKSFTRAGGLIHEAKYDGGQATDLPADQSERSLTILQLDIHHCRWPLFGEGMETMFCADDKLIGHAYCARHCRMAYSYPNSGRRVA